MNGYEREALKAVERVFRDAGIVFKSETLRDNRFDIKIRVSHSAKPLYLECYHSLAPLHFDMEMKRLQNAISKGGYVGIVVQRLTLPLLDACKERYVCVFDFYGNAYVHMPGILIERYRPVPRPKRIPSAGTCFTAKASRLVRAFLANFNRWSGVCQADLARETGLSRGYVSILARRMVDDGYASHRGNLLYLDEPDRLLDDWVSRYRFDRHQRLDFALSMNTYEQGLEKLGSELGKTGSAYAFTGWSGAYLLEPHAEPPTLMAYVERVPESPLLHSVEKQGNVMLLIPQDEGVFQFSNESQYGPIACDPQVYVDVCRMPGRAREQADAFRNERLNFGRKIDGR